MTVASMPMYHRVGVDAPLGALEGAEDVTARR